MSELEITQQRLFLNEAKARHRDLITWQERNEFFIKNHPDLPGWVRSRGYKHIISEIEKHYRYDLIRYLFKEGRTITRTKQHADKSTPKEIVATATAIGGGAHVYVPKQWMGKRLKIIVEEAANE
ncbi:hypothetical protein NTE_01781 [Candidatus Nitrososphaera evergladensis SR1]|uniref:Uncharacterized protein n=1 Tax=Candidatus Nitrososphaera evergladensis SR1 TaxID=1459636 RepID=A0A075MST2_9ARCH|nr:DUF2080 family transposase-associated protein [Candidatus Nitrososphaera evergladensis]AIF83842.1 hypothetical protein NTE_01781 [Candidatus Nitrososphaera evergladensis SR1]